MIVFDDQHYMRMALRQAEKAADADEIPIGCVIVKDNEIISRSWNQVETLQDATAHAEMIALTQAADYCQNWRLTGCTVYVTKEPCAMCAGALSNARVDKVIFALPDARCGGCGGAFDIHQREGMLHRYEVEGGLLQEEALELLQQFFRRRRKESKDERKLQKGLE